MSEPISYPCPECLQEPLTRHLETCSARTVKRRLYVPLSPAGRRWRFRGMSCCVTTHRGGHTYQCHGKAVLWLVGPRGGILGRWCAGHEPIGYRAFLRQHPRSRAVLRDADYQLRSSDEEIAMWAIGNGPNVKPWYGPASRASTG